MTTSTIQAFRERTEPTQNEQILAHLRTGESITAIKAAYLYGVGRLASRIDDLKNDGHKIERRLIRVGKTLPPRFYAEYYMGEVE